MGDLIIPVYTEIWTKYCLFNHLHGETAIEGAFLDKHIISYLSTELYVFALLNKMSQWGFIKCVLFIFTCSKMEKYLPSHMFINIKSHDDPPKSSMQRTQ